MKIILCVDNNNGMMFNHRRQSQDKLLRKRILELTDGCKMWMNAYSQKQFLQDMQAEASDKSSGDSGYTGQIHVDEDFLEKAETEDYCFVEDRTLLGYERKIDEVIICRWNRDYPADMYFELNLDNYKLVETKEYAGSSHEKITEDRYVRK